MPAHGRRRVVNADYNDLSHRTSLGLHGYTLPLGTEDVFPDLATLHDGEPIYATDGMELWSEANARLIVHEGVRYWYAADIATWHDLEDEPLPADAATDPDQRRGPAGPARRHAGQLSRAHTTCERAYRATRVAPRH